MKLGAGTPCHFWRPQWLILIFLFKLSLSFDMSCVQDEIESPSFFYVGEYTMNKTMESYDKCKLMCFMLELEAAAVEDASFCFCKETYTDGDLTAATTCGDSPCSDASDCGGADTTASLKLIDSATDGSPPPDPPKFFELDLSQPDVTTVALNTPVNLVVNASSTSWLLYCNDGNSLQMAPDPASCKYTLPGFYEIKGMLLEDASYSESVTVSVSGTPALGVVCPTLLPLDGKELCNVTYSGQGLDFVVKYTVDKPSETIVSTYNLPGEDIRIFGAAAPIPGGTTTLTNGELLILKDSYSHKERFITRLRGKFSAAGPLDIYAIAPGCTTTSEAYCGPLGACTSGTCPAISEDSVVSCPSGFCSKMATCTAEGVCPSPGSVSSTQFSAILLGSVDATGSETDIDLTQTDSVLRVPAGYKIAFGCKDSSGCPDAYYRASTGEVANDILKSDGTTYSSGTIHDFQVVVASHPYMPLDYEAICDTTAPILNSDVADLFLASNEELIEQTTHSFKMEISSALAGITLTNVNKILCQEEILDPVLSSDDIWIALGSTDKITFTFSQGSPILATADVDGVDLYHYYDDAKAKSFVWEIDLNYANQGYYNLTLNATNLLNSVLANADIHIVPPITNTWTFTVDEPCYTTFPCEVNWNFPMADNPPWNATGNVTHEGLILFALDSPIDFGTFETGAAAKAIDNKNEFVMEDPANMTLQLMLENEVSSEIFTVDFEMKQHIVGVHGLATWHSPLKEEDNLMGIDEDTAMVDREITIVPQTNKGTPDKYRILVTYPDSGEVKEYEVTGDSVTFKLPEEGQYNVTVEAYNEIQGWVASEPINLNIIDRITDPRLLADDVIYKPNELASIYFDFAAFPMTASVIFKYGDLSTLECYGNENECKLEKYSHTKYMGPVLTPPLILKHNYTEENIYNVSALAWDHNGKVQLDVKVTVADLPCLMPRVSIMDPFVYPDQAEQNMRSKIFMKSSLSEIRCNKTMDDVEEYWSIVKVQLEGTYASPIAEESYIKDIDSWTSPTVIFPKLKFEYGIYKLMKTIRINTAVPHIFLEATNFTYLEVTKTPLVAVIFDGGDQIALGFGQKRTFPAAQLSSDPDEVTNKLGVLGVDYNMSWYCKDLESDPWTLDVNGTLDVPDKPRLAIPDSLVAIQEKRTGGGCFGEGDGILDFEGETMELDSSRFVKQEGKFELWIQIEKEETETRYAQSKVILEITRFPPPFVDLSLGKDSGFIDNGNFYVNKDTQVAFTADCKVNPGGKPDYSWEITTESGILLVDDSDPCLSTSTSSDGSATVGSETVACNSVYRSLLTEPSLILSELFTGRNPDEDTFIIRVNCTDKNDPGSPTGYSSKKFTVNKAPKNGICKIDKDNGTSLLDRFVCEVEGWTDPEGHRISSYTIYYEKDGETTILSTKPKSGRFDLILPDGDLHLKVKIADEHGAETICDLGPVTVAVPTDEQLATFNFTDMMNELTKKGDVESLQLLMIAMSSLKNNPESSLAPNMSEIANLVGDDKFEVLKEVGDQNQEMVKVLSDFPIVSGIAAEQVSDQLKKIYRLGGNNTELTKLINDNLTKNITLSKTREVMQRAIEMRLPPEQLKGIILNLMAITSTVAQVDSLLLQQSEEAPPGDVENAKTTPVEFSNDDDTMIQSSLNGMLTASALETTKKQVDDTESMMEGMYDDAAVSILGNMVPGEVFETGSDQDGIFFLAKTTEQLMRNKLTMTVGSGSLSTQITFPAGFCPTKHAKWVQASNCDNNIGLYIMVIPVPKHFTVKTIKLLSEFSHSVVIKLLYNGKEISYNDTSSPIIFTVPLKPMALSEPYKFNFNKDKNKHLPFVIARFVTKRNGTIVKMRMIPISPIPLNTIVLIRYGAYPTASKFFKKIPINNFKTQVDGTLTFLLKHPVLNHNSGNFSAGFGVLKNSDLIKKDRFERTDFLEKAELNFKVTFNTAACFYFNKYEQIWSDADVTTTDSEPDKTHCYTTHLTTFGSGFFPSPNDINFAYIFGNAGFLDNLTLYIFLIVVACWFIIMMIWAHWMDRKDDERRGLIPLPDNQPQDKYLYELVFHTGPDDEATTESNIMIMVSGDLDETEVRFLPASTDHLYRRYGVDYFVMSTPGPLGYISGLRIMTDNTGEPPLDSWQLYKVEIRDLQTLDKFVFETDAWLAFDRDIGRVDRLFHVAIPGEEQSFSRKLYHNSNKVTNQDHIFMSMFYRPVYSRYGRKERVLVCAAFLFLSMLLSVIWFETRPSSKNNGILTVGPFSLSPEAVITGFFILLVAYPAMYLVSLVFKRARPRNLLRCRAIEAIERQREHQFMEVGLSASEAGKKSKVEVTNRQPTMKEISRVECIPWWTRLIAWIVLLGIIGGSIFVIWSYGIMFGETKTTKCFSAFLLSFFIANLLIQWLNIIFFSFTSTCWCSDYFSAQETDCDEEIPHMKEDESWLYRRPHDNNMSRWIHEVEGVDSEDPEVIALRSKLTKNREMKGVMKGLGVYCLFLAILTVIVSSKINKDFFYLQNHLKNSFIKEGHLDMDFADKIKTADDWWLWCKTVVMQEMRAYKYYNGKPTYDLIGYLDDWQNRVMGYAIFRQVRSARNTCIAPHPFEEYIGRCSGIRGVANEDSKDYCSGWLRNASSPGYCTEEEFKHKDSNQVGAYGLNARLGSYSGGGYVFPLKPIQSKIFKRMDELQQRHWIDKNTRAVFLEFSVYNVNLNLFAMCTIVAEFTEGGGIIPYWRFDVLKLSRDVGFWGSLNIICEILFVVSIGLFTLNELWKMKKEKSKYIDSYWNLAELCIVLVSYVIIGLHFYRDSLLDKALTEFQSKGGNTYVRVDSAAIIEIVYVTLLALVQFFSYLKLIKFLQFNNRMNMLALTIKGCWDELKVFFIAFGFVFFAFSSLFYFMFIWYLEEFSTIYKAIQTSFKMMMGKFDFQAMKDANALSPLLFFVFSVLNSMILINIMLTIILQSFTNVKMAMENRDNRLNLIDFIWSNMRQKVRKERRPRIHVEPKLRARNEDDSHHPNEIVRNKTEELPGKVSQLMNQINQVYFDGKLDLSDPNTQKTLVSEEPQVHRAHNFKEPVIYGSKKIYYG